MNTSHEVRHTARKSRAHAEYLRIAAAQEAAFANATDPLALSWAVARKAGCIAVGERGGDLVCAPCLRDAPVVREDAEIIGVLRVATSDDLTQRSDLDGYKHPRVPYCVCCGRSLRRAMPRARKPMSREEVLAKLKAIGGNAATVMHAYASVPPDERAERRKAALNAWREREGLAVEP